MSGRPIRFLGVTLIGWVGVRAFMLWPTMGPAAIPRTVVPAAVADATTPAEIAPPLPPHSATDAPPQPQTISLMIHRSIVGIVNMPASSGAPSSITVPGDAVATVGVSATPQETLAPPPAVSAIANPATSRWSASAWLVLRDGSGIAPGLGGGQLGGSQAGLRVAYAIGGARRVAIVGRVTTPLKGSGREAALGVEWRPTPLPVRLVTEYRFALDRGTSGPAAGVIAGTGPAPLALGFDLETYGQAGVVRRRRAELFAEGAARLSRRVLSVAGAKVDLGLGGWGGAQRGVQRLDVGPSLGIRIPVAGKALRASIDWRQRILGNARPGSGPILVIGGDF